jgi:hypothetical protein
VPETEFIEKDLIDIDAINNRSRPIIDELCFEHMHHLLLFMYDTFENFRSRARRILSVVLFGTLRLAGVSFRTAKEILEQLPVLTPEVCQSWLKRIVEEKDIRVVLDDKRGSYERTTFWEYQADLIFLSGKILN